MYNPILHSLTITEFRRQGGSFETYHDGLERIEDPGPDATLDAFPSKLLKQFQCGPHSRSDEPIEDPMGKFPDSIEWTEGPDKDQCRRFYLSNQNQTRRHLPRSLRRT